MAVKAVSSVTLHFNGGRYPWFPAQQTERQIVVSVRSKDLHSHGWPLAGEPITDTQLSLQLTRHEVVLSLIK